LLDRDGASRPDRIPVAAGPGIPDQLAGLAGRSPGLETAAARHRARDGGDHRPRDGRRPLLQERSRPRVLDLPGPGLGGLAIEAGREWLSATTSPVWSRRATGIRGLAR